MYQKITENGYIVSIASGVTNGNITESEYNTIRQKLKVHLEAPIGKEYRLREDLTWELVDLPSVDINDEDYELDAQDLLEMLKEIM